MTIKLISRIIDMENERDEGSVNSYLSGNLKQHSTVFQREREREISDMDMVDFGKNYNTPLKKNTHAISKKKVKGERSS